MLLAMKHVYQQGWILTTLKYFAVGITYNIVLFFVILIAAAIGFLTF